jgi:hypothetical protein
MMTITQTGPCLMSSGLKKQGATLQSTPSPKKTVSVLPDQVQELTNQYFNEKLYKWNSDDKQAMQKSIDRLKQALDNSPLAQFIVNPTMNSHQNCSLQEAAERLEKAKEVYEIYRTYCIEKILKKSPLYICKKLNLDETAQNTIQDIFTKLSHFLFHPSLKSEFDTFHSLCANRVIHYALGIPENFPGAKTHWFLHPLKSLTSS